ncbi:MAG: ring-cleaving dioxygenase [Patescibacteria group bacterium]
MHVSSIHHITAVSSDPVQTHHFYTKILGLRLVKKSVNQDDTATYHLFFGNTLGTPGMDLTFFPFQPVVDGRRGPGVVSKISLSIPRKSLKFWQKRFEQFSITFHESLDQETNEQSLIFFDEDNQQLELVATDSFAKHYEQAVWSTTDVPTEHAIRCFHQATLSVASAAQITPVLEVLGFSATQNSNAIWQLPKTANANQLEILVDTSNPRGIVGAGTVHHIAFGVPDDEAQLQVKSAIQALGLQTTAVIDRFYFKSVYFLTPAGILFEIATDQPGFTADQSESELGKTLALPPFLESQRSSIEAKLPPLPTNE